MNGQQCRAAYDLLKYLLENDNPKDIAEKLVNCLVKKAFLKIRSKVEQERPNSFDVTLPKEEALALEIYCNKLSLVDIFHYEVSVMKNISNTIDQRYA